MTVLSTFYLVCFVAGFVLTVLSLILGHLHLHIHLPHLHEMDSGAGHGVGHGPHMYLTAHGSEISPINFSTVTAFLTWFGGMGYLLTRYYGFFLVLGLAIATVSGLGGAALIFVFMVRVLAPRQTQLDPADFDLVGTLAHICSSIREKGTGEIIFSQGGTRKTSGARSVDGRPLEKGAEVVITKYEGGIAYVQRWEEFTK